MSIPFALPQIRNHRTNICAVQRMPPGPTRTYRRLI